MSIGFKKALRDIMQYKGRALMSLIGILIGAAAFGSVLSAYSILNREMNSNFMDTNPAFIVIYASNLDDKAIGLITQSHNDLDVDFRKTVQARIGRGDSTYGTIYLRAVQDFKNQKVDTFTLENGRFPSIEPEMVIERDCLKILRNIKTGVDENVHIKLPGGMEKDMVLSGKVHAPGLAPASMENYSYAFLSLDSLRSLGYKGWFDEIRIVSHENRFDRDSMKILSQDIAKMLENNGYAITKIDVPVPGKHPHADQLSSLLFLLQAFAVISLLAACLIIINLINFIMSRQIKQIAIMKAVGADTVNIAAPFVLYVLIISIAAIILSFPLSISVGNGYSNFAAGILNFNISSYAIPHWVLLLQIIVGILLPLTAAAYPIYKSSSISVKDGLFERVGNTVSTQKKRLCLNNLLPSINSRISISINNLLRKKSRTSLAILALLAGGVLYMTSQNIIASIDQTIAATAKNLKWDYDIVLWGNYQEKNLKEVLGAIDGLDGYEVWNGNTILLTDGSMDSVNCPVRIMPENSKMISSSIARRLDDASGKNVVIVNNGITKEEKWIKPGMTLQASINQRKAQVEVLETVKEVPPMPMVYMSLNTYERLFDGKSRQIIFAHAKTRNILEQRNITRDIESKFGSANVEIAENWNVYVLRKAFADHLVIIITFLAAISILAVVVGGLSIGTAIGINVSERKRELGILRAAGANRHQIILMILTEVLIMGIISWSIAVILSYPVSQWVGNYFGQIFLGSNLQTSFSLSGSIQWLVISSVVSFTAGILPAWRISSAPLKEMLAYE